MKRNLLLSMLALFLLAVVPVRAQQPVGCNNFCVQSITWDSSAANSWLLDIQFSYAASAFINYPYVTALTSMNGDTIGTGMMNLFGQINNTTSQYSVQMNALGMQFNPFTFQGYVHFTYDSTTCVLSYPCNGASSCSFTYSQSPGTSAVIFYLSSPFSNQTHYAVWNFGNGTTSSTAYSSPQGAITALYNTPGIYGACVDIIDSLTGNTVCTYCDTVVVAGSTNNCYFSASPVPGTNTSWSFSGVPSYSTSTLQWSFGDGSSGNGNSPSHTYGSPGAYVVCMYEVNPNGVTVCSYCDSIYVSGVGCQANFTYGQQGNTFSFIPSVTGGPVSSYLWSFGNGMTSTLPTVTYSYNAPGTYVVCLTIATASGCVDSVCQVVTVPQSTNCQISIIPDTSQANSYYFQTTSNASMLNVFSWNFGDGTTGNGFATSHTYANPGTYNVCVTETTQNGVVVCTSCMALVVGGGGVSCTFASSSIQGVPGGMLFTTPSVPGVLYNWDFGDGSPTVVSTSNSVSHNFSNTGFYNVCLTLTQAGNTVCTYCDSVYVQGGANCNFSWTQAGPANPLSLLFAGPSYPNATYIWSWGDGTTSTTVQGPSIIHTYAQAGTYQVCLQITSNGAVVCTSCMMVTVAGGSPSCQADFVSVSVGLQAYFIDQSIVSPNTPIFYSWNFGDGNTSTLQFPNHQYSAPGWYNPCLVITNGNCTSIYCDSIFIDTAVVLPVNCNSFFVFTQTAPYNIVAVNLASGVNLSFNWDFGDGTTSSAAYPSHQYSSTGSYLLCLTVSDPTGCTDTYCDTLTVDSTGNIVYRGASAGFVLNVLAPNQLTGVEEPAFQVGALYPVPAREQLTFSLDANAGNRYTCFIRSIDGRLQMSTNLTNGTHNLDIANLASGVYLLEVNGPDGSLQTKRFIKE